MRKCGVLLASAVLVVGCGSSRGGRGGFDTDGSTTLEDGATATGDGGMAADTGVVGGDAGDDGDIGMDGGEDGSIPPVEVGSCEGTTALSCVPGTYTLGVIDGRGYYGVIFQLASGGGSCTVDQTSPTQQEIDAAPLSFLSFNGQPATIRTNTAFRFIASSAGNFLNQSVDSVPLSQAVTFSLQEIATNRIWSFTATLTGSGASVQVQISDAHCTETDPTANCKLYYADKDGDGYGDANAAPKMRCDGASGYVTRGGDCRDLNEEINPEASEVCNDEDDDCDGTNDDGLPTQPYYPDSDGDGYGATDGTPVQDCSVPSGYGPPGDCCDSDTAAHPGVVGYPRVNNEDDYLDHIQYPTMCGHFDYNCSGTAEVAWPQIGSCEKYSATSCRIKDQNGQWVTPGVITWLSSVPGCGQVNFYIDKCLYHAGLDGCDSSYDKRYQHCN